MQGFKLEWKQKLPLLAGQEIVTIYFGGGTPSLLGPHRIANILDLIRQTHPFQENSIEITLEANPENIHAALIKDYAKAGINRVSIGIQTLDDALLKRLGRIHSSEKAIDAVHMTCDAGIENISIDLMYDIPGQTILHWENTLDKICRLPICHLSLYNLTIEPHTVFFKHQKELQKTIPDEASSLQMYEMAVSRLAAVGLDQYEISAFAKKGFQSRHNMGYWLARPFLGFGPSAFSDWQGKRFRNVAHLNRYLRALQADQSPVDFEEELHTQARTRELFIIALRLLTGVDIPLFEQQHGHLDAETQKTLDRLIEQDLLQKKKKHISLTRRGILFYDTIASELV